MKTGNFGLPQVGEASPIKDGDVLNARRGG
jgi:hypothetical protein